MKKNVYLVIITVITIALIFVGLIWNLGIFTGISFPWNQTRENTGSSAKITRTWEGADLGDCRELIIDIDASDVTVTTGDHGSILYEGAEKRMPEVAAENGRWTIKQNMDRIVFFGKDSFGDSRIVVTLPEGQVPEKVDLNADAGDLSIKGINTQTLSIVADAGDIDLEGFETQTLKLDIDAGDIDIADSTFANGTVDADAGDLLIKNSSFTSLTGDFDMGNVKVSSASPLDDAVLDLEVDMGEITVNGEEKGRDYHQNGSSGIRLAVTADLGDIKVDW